MSVLRYLPVGPVLALLGLAVVVVVVVVLVTPRDRRGRAARVGAQIGLGVYVVALLAVTLLRSGGGNGVNLVPFAGIAGQLTNVNKELAVANLAGNVLMFVPLPALIRFSFVRSWARALGLAVCSSIVIELVQSGIGRSADIDDVLLNSAGALIGAGVGFGIEALARRHRRIQDQVGVA